MQPEWQQAYRQASSHTSSINEYFSGGCVYVTVTAMAANPSSVQQVAQLRDDLVKAAEASPPVSAGRCDALWPL